MRRVLALCLLALLLSMQHEAQVHAFSHLSTQAGHSHEAGLASTLADAECATCGLLAAGSNAVSGTSQSFIVAAPAEARARSVFRSRAVAAPVYTSSRAPPVLS